jgi:hypothetical protein
MGLNGSAVIVVGWGSISAYGGLEDSLARNRNYRGH